MTEYKKALKAGAGLRSASYVYTIIEPEQQDGFGITYLAWGEPVNPEPATRQRPGLIPGVPGRADEGQNRKKKFIIREHFMFHCSDRGEDDKELAIDEYSTSTVKDFQNVFKNTVGRLKKATKKADEFLQIVDDFEANGTYYYVTECLPGPNLKQYIQQHGKLTIREARVVLEPIFHAVRRFHTHRILHTGLAPEAIIISNRPDGSVRPALTQLYSCKMFSSAADGELQLPPLSCPDRYAPREQYGELDKFIPQTNIYSLAAMVFFALTGEEPPLAEDVDEDSIATLLPEDEDIPASFRSAVIKAMRPDWHERYESVTLFNSALLESIITDDDRIREEKHNDPVNRRRRRWHTWMILAVVLAMIAAVVMIFVKLNQ